MNKKIVLLILVLGWVILSGDANVMAGDRMPEPIFPIERVKKVELGENRVPREVMYYEFALKLKLVEKQNAKYDTPEDTLISLFSSIEHMDRGWFSKCFVRSRGVDDDAKSREKDLSRWKSYWGSLKGATTYLKRRIDGDTHVYLTFFSKRRGDDPIRRRGAFAFKKTPSGWKIDNTLPMDAERRYLNTGKTGN